MGAGPRSPSPVPDTVLQREAHGRAAGGHGSGRKLPIVFAGLLLDDPVLANISKSFPKASFGEDEQTESVILYVESLRNARKFMTAARAFARTRAHMRAWLCQSARAAVLLNGRAQVGCVRASCA